MCWYRFYIVLKRGIYSLACFKLVVVMLDFENWVKGLYIGYHFQFESIDFGVVFVSCLYGLQRDLRRLEIK